MTKIYALLIFDTDQKLVYKNFELSDFSFFIRSNIMKEIEETSKNLISIAEKNSQYRINEKIANYEFTIYSNISSNDRSTLYGSSSSSKMGIISCIIITNKEYPTQTAYQLMNHLTTISINKINLDQLFVQYQNPKEVDKLFRLQAHLDETRVILLDSLNKLHERHENLKNLSERTENLVSESVKFQDTSKDLNRCCVVM
jgi:hypothetical protein